MTKDYRKWHVLKINIENLEKEVLFRDQEIWWCSLGENIGFEEDGKNEKYERPVLVFRKFHKGMFFGLPLTSKEKDNKFHFKLTLSIPDENGVVREKVSYVILSQLRLFSSKRMIRRMVHINDNVFKELKEKFFRLLN